MTVQIQAIEFNAREHLVAFIKKKLEKLVQFFDRIIGVQVFLSLDNKNRSVKDKIVKVAIKIPGSQIIVSEMSKTFEEAAALAVQSSKRQLKRYKEKLRARWNFFSILFAI